MPTALLIDDELLIAWTLARDHPAWTILSATDGATGLDILRTRRSAHEPLDLIILDVSMPHMDGRDVCACIRRIDDTVPILPFSTVTDPAVDEYLQDWGCAPLLSKRASPAQRELAMERARTSHMPIALPNGARTELQNRARAIEQAARAHGTAWRSAVYSETLITRIGLTQLMALVCGPVMHTPETRVDLDRLLAYGEIDVLLTMAEDWSQYNPNFTTCPCQLLLIAPDLGSGQAVHHKLKNSDRPFAVVIDSPILLRVLHAAAHSLREGHSFVDPLLADVAPHLPFLVDRLRAELNWPGANMTMAHLVALIAQNVPSDEMARRLQLSMDALYSARYRLRRRLDISDDCLQTWTQQWLVRALAETLRPVVTPML